MSKLSKEQEILRQVELAKRSTFGVTGVKIELEAKFNREYYEYDGRCECGDDGWMYCEAGCDDGRVLCERCDGDEWVRCEDTTCEDTMCEICPNCSGDGWIRCLERCDNGRIRCPDHNDGDNYDLRSESACLQWLLRYLSQYDLAEKDDDGRWKPKKPLVYAKFYNDPSVDSELTATLSLKKSKNIFLLPKLVEAWNALGEEIGQGVELDNAGMHMALINDPNCVYPSYPNGARHIQYNNFRQSMGLLLPALYFLGSHKETARSLHFREPRVSDDEKYSAIYYTGGALEFRIFDTCYEKPEAVLDNFVVMRNCIRFWTNTYKSPKLDKIVKECRFGSDRGNGIDRFYATGEHIDLLNAGLRKLKPAYYTIKQLKEQRKFKTSKRRLNTAIKEQKREAEVAYKEYASRFEYSQKAKRHQYIAELLQHRIGRANAEQLLALEEGRVLEEVEAEAEQFLLRESARKQDLPTYIESRINEFLEYRRGDFTLRAY